MTGKRIYVTFIVTLALLSAMFLTELVVVSVENDKNKRTVENFYESTVYDLTDSLDNLKVNMSKLMVARGSGDNRELITDTYRQAEIATTLASKLPISEEEISKTVKFLNQVGDWCVSYNRAIDGGEKVDRYREQADEIFEVTAKLSDGFIEIGKQISEKGVYASVGEGRIMPSNFKELIFDIQSSSVEYPELIYDGPFSDDKTFDIYSLNKMREIDEEIAKSEAEKLFSLKADSASVTEGKIASIVVIGNVDGKEAMASFTKKGGLPLCYDKYRGVGAVRLGRRDCEQRAESYAKALGMGELKAVWYNTAGGVAIVNLAPYEDGIIYYTALVKVKVAMDDGEIIGLESQGYYMGGHDRSKRPVMDEGTARSLVSSKLKVKSVRLAVIPKAEKEVLCYEVNGEYKGLDYFVYLDAVTGKEINVLRVVDNAQGSLTM